MHLAVHIQCAIGRCKLKLIHSLLSYLFTHKIVHFFIIATGERSLIYLGRKIAGTSNLQLSIIESLVCF